MKIRHSLLLLFFLFHFIHLSAQGLRPGFDQQEYIEMLKITERQRDTPWVHVNLPPPGKFKMTYRSPVVGLDNRWDLWMSGDTLAVISIRGTTKNTTSWLANFYAAMVPAKGTIHPDSGFTFNYNLSDNPKAAIHVGWLIGMSYISSDVLSKMDDCIRKGVKDFIILGHSQGGAIAYLMTSYLHNQVTSGRLPSDLRFKTYCSAAPKPGNLYYAYDYESITQFGWSFNVINAADWVPEMPVSIQKVTDFNTVNPFANIDDVIRNLKFPKNLVLRHVYNKLERPTRKAQNRYQKYLGRKASQFVKKSLHGFQPPTYFPSSNYVRTGQTIIMQPDSGYYNSFPDSKTNIFIHHMPNAYIYLAERLKIPTN